VNWLIRILDYLYIARPILFFPGWATMIAGYFTATGESTSGLPILRGIKPEIWNSEIVLAMLMLGAAMGGGAILNQLKDIATDRKNQKLFLIGEGFVPVSHAYAESILLILLSLLLSLKLGWPIFVILLIAIFEAGYLYNFPPFSLKNYPVRGLFANMAMGGFVFVIGWLMAQPFNTRMLINVLPFLFFNTALYLLTTLPDIEGDSLSGKITFAVKYGVANTIRGSIVFFSLALITSIILSNGFLFLVLLVVSPFILWAYIRKTIEAAIIALKMGIFFFSIGICIKFLSFFCLIIAAYIITRFYYKTRLGVDYPNFKGQ
jgi:4-hydroxybenzoate polyprenyltransferase